MSLGFVIPIAQNRKENLELVLDSIDRQINSNFPVVLIYDGEEALKTSKINKSYSNLKINEHVPNKHKPGMEPPRNLGARILSKLGCTHVHFLDSDVYIEPGSVDAVLEQIKGPKRIICGYYDWLASGERDINETDLNLDMHDYRIDMFKEFKPEEVLEYHLGAALANFSGNLVWPLEEFKRVGGFHPGLSAGRVDDGELGVRAAVYGVGTSFLAENRGHHLWHEVDLVRVHEINTKEVPLINKWHPYIQDKGIIPRKLDGIRFNFQCSTCGEEVNTLEMWPHYLAHENGPDLSLPQLDKCENTGLYKPNCCCGDCYDEMIENNAPPSFLEKWERP